jgi:peptide/nickel transport system substrate-binding protein
VFRLKQAFPLLPDALGHASYNMCAIMPKHIAETDPFKQITEAIGSGPFRFRAERVQGAFFAYERFDHYKPREDGSVSLAAGLKIVPFDRVEWHGQPDAATKAAAMRAEEPDLLPPLRKHKIATPILPTGMQVMLRPNHLYPPFDRPEVRRAFLSVLSDWGC